MSVPGEGFEQSGQIGEAVDGVVVIRDPAAAPAFAEAVAAVDQGDPRAVRTGLIADGVADVDGGDETAAIDHRADVLGLALPRSARGFEVLEAVPQAVRREEGFDVTVLRVRDNEEPEPSSVSRARVSGTSG